MLTLESIYNAFSKVKTGADFPALVRDLKNLGVMKYTNYVVDGTTDFFGNDSSILKGNPKYAPLKIVQESSAEKLKHALSIHQKGETDYLTFCQQAADSGVEKWTTHTHEMTVSYYDKSGSLLLAESIPSL